MSAPVTRVVALGECMVELAPTDAPDQYRMGFAGDTLNTAWYLRRLTGPETQVDYVTAVGQDASSERMLAFLRDAGLGTDHILRRADRTVGLYMIQLRAGERSFDYWRGQSAARTMAQDPAALAAALDGADMAYFSGISLAILPPEDRGRFLDALRAVRDRGGRVVFDPNLRPKLWSSPGEMTDAIMQAAAVSTIILPSHEDEAAWFGDADIAATADRYAATGAETIVVKNGPDEMLLHHAGRRTRTCAQRVETVVDTTAAGDSFNAGFLAHVLKGHTMDQAMTAGAGIAAQVIQARGALVPIVV